MSLTSRFTVSWPLQGVACFRGGSRELIVSDVYWRWILDEVRRIAAIDGDSSELVRTMEEGFCDPDSLVERIPVTGELMKRLQRVDVANAPSFDLLVADNGLIVPTPQHVLSEFVALVDEAGEGGTMEIEIE